MGGVQNAPRWQRMPHIHDRMLSVSCSAFVVQVRENVRGASLEGKALKTEQGLKVSLLLPPHAKECVESHCYFPYTHGSLACGVQWSWYDAQDQGISLSEICQQNVVVVLMCGLVRAQRL